jgi:hypothetical protein
MSTEDTERKDLSPRREERQEESWISRNPSGLGELGVLARAISCFGMGVFLMLALAVDPAAAADAPKQAAKADKTAPAASDAKTLSGISILGNQEAPKSLVIVPWKGSEIGDMPALSRLLDDSVQPVDKDVFMRELAYYEIRSGK